MLGPRGTKAEVKQRRPPPRQRRADTSCLCGRELGAQIFSAKAQLHRPRRRRLLQERTPSEIGIRQRDQPVLQR
jgi:hypothetical protein